MNTTTWGNTYWPWFLIVVSVAFLGPEIFALVSHSTNSLSEYAWRELHVQAGIPFSKHQAAWLLSLGMWGVGVFWLTEHIWFYHFR